MVALTPAQTSAILPRRVLRWIGDGQLGPVFLEDHAIDDVGCGGDEIETKSSFQPFSDDLHVQQAEEADPEAKAQGARCLRFIAESSVVQLKFVQRLSQLGVSAPSIG